jgi:hypothetical protein
VYRSISNAFCSLLLTVSYLWGGCVSCEQFFMLPRAKDRCCEALRCKKPLEKPADQPKSEPTPQACQTMPWDRLAEGHFNPEIAASLQASPAHTITSADIFDSGHVHLRVVSQIDPVADSPPDLPTLNSSFLI